MIGFALDANHDMHLGQRAALALVEGADFVVQSIRTRLLLLKGEWWLDTSDGTPWRDDIMVKPADLPATESTLKRRILGTDGVLRLLTFDLTYKAAERELVVQFSVSTAFGPSDVVEVTL